MDILIQLVAVAGVIIVLLSIGFAWGAAWQKSRPDWGHYELKPKNPRQL